MLLSHEELFVYSVEDLRNRVKGDSKYDWLRATALCRHLVMEPKAPTLFKLVNPREEFQLVFTVVEVQQFEGQKNPFQIVWQTIDPEKRRAVSGSWNEVKLNEDQFRSYKILHHYNNSFTVLDVMQVAWYVMGGVHSVPPKKVQKALVALDATAHTEERLTFFAFKAICNVILRALEPVEGTLKSKTDLLKNNNK